LHWRWPSWYQETIRDGLKVWFKNKPKAWTEPQKKGATLEVHELMKEKLKSVRDRWYVKAGPVKSLTSFFAVPKGEDDIRMVYDGTKLGLNDSIWVPRFPLPTVDTEGHRALGACEELSFWRLWIGNCAVCGETMKEGEGNFYANFRVERGSFPPYKKVWCKTCYRPRWQPLSH